MIDPIARYLRHAEHVPVLSRNISRASSAPAPRRPCSGPGRRARGALSSTSPPSWSFLHGFVSRHTSRKITRQVFMACIANLTSRATIAIA